MEKRASYRRRGTRAPNGGLDSARPANFTAQNRHSQSQFFQKFSGIKPENIFLYVAIVLGLIFAIFQPLFIEPDSSYHFERSTYIANTVVDRSVIGFFGEDYSNVNINRAAYDYKGSLNVSDWQKGLSWMSSTVKNGSYFKLFFQTKLPLVNKNKVQDPRAKEGGGWLGDISHVVPALGVLIGYHIYPSLGAMVITARILNLTFFILALFFIIKRLAAYKLIFVFVSLSPTVIQLATSLSYDCYGYVAFAFAAACLINAAHRLKHENKIAPAVALKSLGTLAFSSLALFFAKSNFWLLFVLIGLVALATISRVFVSRLSPQVVAMMGIGVFAFGALIVIIVLNSKLLVFLPKLYYTLLEPYYTVLSTEVLSGTATVGIPNWLVPIQFLVLFLVFLSQREEVLPRWFAWAGLTLAAVNLFGVLYTYALNPDFIKVSKNVIIGPQGRYFTPFLLVLGPVFTLLAKKISVNSGHWLKRLVIIVSVASLALNFSVSATRFYVMHKPLDEFQSGVQHYIFK